MKSSFKIEKEALKAPLKVMAATLCGETRSIENDYTTLGEWLNIKNKVNQK